MGIIKNRLRDAMLVYRRNHDLLRFIKEIGDIADSHIHYQWQRNHFDNKLDEAYKELLGNGNPSDRRGSIEVEQDKIFEPCQYLFTIAEVHRTFSTKSKTNSHIIEYGIFMRENKSKFEKAWLVAICPFYQQAENLLQILRIAGNSQLLRLTYVAEERDDMKHVVFS